MIKTLVQSMPEERLLPTTPVATVGELVAILLSLPPETPLTAPGADSGGYDQIIGSDVFVDIIDGAFRISHVDERHRADVAAHNKWWAAYKESEDEEDDE